MATYLATFAVKRGSNLLELMLYVLILSLICCMGLGAWRPFYLREVRRWDRNQFQFDVLLARRWAQISGLPQSLSWPARQCSHRYRYSRAPRGPIFHHVHAGACLYSKKGRIEVSRTGWLWPDNVYYRSELGEEKWRAGNFYAKSLTR